MDSEVDDVPWLSEREMVAWRAYMVATLMLRHRLHRELVDEHELALSDYEVLVYLSWQPDRRMRMTELASSIGSTKSRLSHQIGRMEKAGMVRRTRDPGDKRGVVAEMTEQGQQMLDNAAPTHVAGVREHVIDRLDPKEQEVMGEAFTRVLKHLTALDG